jgi:flavin-dependent dehydrogenase
MAAERLARAGKCVTLFEEKIGWEKPCGGGLPYKALRRYPFLLDAVDEHVTIRDAELVAANGSATRLHLRQPLVIYSRSVLNRLLLRRAQAAGAEIVQDRIHGFRREGGGWRLEGRRPGGEAGIRYTAYRKRGGCGAVDDMDALCHTPSTACPPPSFYSADYLILADGARSQLRSLLAPPLGAQDFMLTFGYYVPVVDRLLRVQFFEGFEGYAWSFPRTDHLDLGICGKVGESDMAGMHERLHGFMKRFGYLTESATVFSHLLPALCAESWNNLRIAGDSWALAGDVAGLVDPVTGEGIYFALRSGELLGEALLDTAIESYPERVWQDFGKRLTLGARLSRYFYHEDFLGQPSTTRLVEFSARSRTFLELLQDLLDGSQSYDGLDRRLYRTLGMAILEMATAEVRKQLSVVCSQLSAATDWRRGPASTTDDGPRGVDGGGSNGFSLSD